MSSRSGLTLIEVLIAVSLLGLLSIGVLWSMRIGFNTMEKIDNRLVHNRRVANSRKIIENELNGYLAATAALHPRPNEITYVPFVQAEPTVMRFVTNYSLEEAWRGRLQLVTMHVIEGDKQKGGVRLVMEETPYLGPEQAGQLVTGMEMLPETGLKLHFAEAVPGARSFVLADQLGYCRFSYLERTLTPPFQIWRTEWVNSYNLPRAVRIDMTPLDAANNQLHVSAVSVALPVTRFPGRRYGDD